MSDERPETSFYKFCDKNKDKLKNLSWSSKQAAYVKHMKEVKKSKDSS